MSTPTRACVECTCRRLQALSLSTVQHTNRSREAQRQLRVHSLQQLSRMATHVVGLQGMPVTSSCHCPNNNSSSRSFLSRVCSRLSSSCSSCLLLMLVLWIHSSCRSGVHGSRLWHLLWRAWSNWPQQRHCSTWTHKVRQHHCKLLCHCCVTAVSHCSSRAEESPRKVSYRGVNPAARLVEVVACLPCMTVLSSSPGAKSHRRLLLEVLSCIYHNPWEAELKSIRLCPVLYAWPSLLCKRAVVGGTGGSTSTLCCVPDHCW